MKVYYAHCVSIYGTPQERRDLGILERMGFDVANPNCQECTDGYKSEGMEFFRTFAENCDALAFAALPDGRIPAGVAKEIEMFREHGKPVVELPRGIHSRVMSVEETREYLHEVGQR